MNPAVVTAIKARLAALWTTCPVQWANEDFQAPNPPAPWVFAEIRALDSKLLAMGSPGNNTLQDDGFIRLHLYVPYHSGTDIAYQYADQLSAIFRLQSFSGVQCLAPSPADGGAGDDDGDWFRVSVSVPFYVIYQG